MNCPKCNKGMEAKHRNGARFNYCLICEGAWLPKDSLNLLYEQSTSRNNNLKIPALALESDKISDSIKCPNCVNLGLIIVLVHGIELDVCDNCTGVFFDMGEMESLAEKLKTNEKEFGMGEYVASEGLFWMIMALFSGG